jgi:nucleoside-diphosphate-sugar epimerase
MRIVITGAGGFIGHHLVNRLVGQGHFVRGIDIKKPEYDPTAAHEFINMDLRFLSQAQRAFQPSSDEPWDRIYMLAADMGGMGYIKGHDALILSNNLLINLHSLMGANTFSARTLFTSSACVYPIHLQQTTAVTALTENDAYPANPEDGYGWEKLTTEKLCTYFSNDYGVPVRIARFHNIFGPLGTWRGGREKAPAAMCRKVAEAKLTSMSEIEMWGDGEQTRSFCYIDDCVDGLVKLMESDYQLPLNIGSDQMISINDLAYAVMNIANYHCRIRHIDGPQGVRGRNSDNTQLRKVLEWEPQIELVEGLARTYRWIEQEVAESLSQSQR